MIEDHSSFDGLAKRLQLVLTVLVASGSVIAASGFIVVHSHISKYTDIPIINVPFENYLIAGLIMAINITVLVLSGWIGLQIGAVLDSVLQPIEKITNRARKLLVTGVVSLVLLLLIILWLIAQPEIIEIGILFFLPYVILALIFSRSIHYRNDERWLKRFTGYFLQPSRILADFYRSIISFLAFVVYISLYVMLIGSVYGSAVYNILPIAAGGGQPARVSLIFYDASAPNIVSMVSDYRTSPICLLLSTKDSLLVYDPSIPVTIAISKGSIHSIVDEQLPEDCSA